MAKRKPAVPPYEGVHRTTEVSPGPRETVQGHIVDDDTRSLPARRASKTPARPRGKKFKGRVYESAGRQRARKTGAAVGALGVEATEAARRSAIRSTAGGKPSVAGRAGSGALAGAGAGAAVGTAVGGPVGAAVGAGVGAAGGAVVGGTAGSKEKRQWKASMRADSAGPRKVLVAEFLICMIIAAFSPLTKDEDTPGRLMKQLTALCLLFFGLGLLTSAGRGAARTAAAAGGVVTLVLVVGHRNLLVKVAEIFNRGNRPADTTARRIPAGER